MDKTFAETQGQPAFDWNKWLDAAIANPGLVTHQDWVAKQSLAKSWVTCACGNQCAIIPRHDDEDWPGMPVDEELSSLGSVFYHEILDRQYSAAKLTLSLIEVRAQILIASELAALKANQEGRR